MANLDVLREYKMPEEIRKIVRRKGFKAPRPSDVQRSLTRMYQQEPDRFSSEESRRVAVHDIADGFIARYKREKKGPTDTERATIDGEWIPYPTGYEYAVLAAYRLSPILNEVRRNLELPDAKPFTSFVDAVAWVNALHSTRGPVKETAPARSTFAFDLPTDVAKELEAFLLERLDPVESHISPDPEGVYKIYNPEALVNGIANLLAETLIDKISIKHQEDSTTRTLSLFSSDDIKESEGVTGEFEADKKSANLFEYCETFARILPEWDASKILSYIVLNRLPILPVRFHVDKIEQGQKLLKFSMEIPFPMSDETLLGFYKTLIENSNSPQQRLYNFDPPTLREYDLVLLELSLKMPVADFTWSHRLTYYLNRYEKEINASFLPDLGLKGEKSSSSWENAVRNMGRDYKRVIAKLT